MSWKVDEREACSSVDWAIPGMQSRVPRTKNSCWRIYIMRSSLEYVYALVQRLSTGSFTREQFPYFRTAPPGWKVSQYFLILSASRNPETFHMIGYAAIRLDLAVQTELFIDFGFFFVEFRPSQPLSQSMLREGAATPHGPWQGLVLDGQRQCRSPNGRPQDSEEERQRCLQGLSPAR